ncbi:hypothetical protein KY285_007686 [Solanum tuberosum]|nr:hypothetical protein KY285_007686 [Solanum tuberosum]
MKKQIDTVYEVTSATQESRDSKLNSSDICSIHEDIHDNQSKLEEVDKITNLKEENLAQKNKQILINQSSQIIEKDSPMQDLHEINSDQLHEVNIIESKESRVDGVEDKDENNNNINSKMVEMEGGLSPHAISKGLKGKNKGENNKVEKNGMMTRTSLKMGVKSGVK